MRTQISLRTLLAVVAVLAVVLGTFVTCIKLPAERRRVRNMERAVSLQIDLLRSAVARARGEAKSEQERARECRDKAQDEEREAARWPESSEERTRHLNAALLWARAGDEASRNAERIEAQARKVQVEVTALAARRTQSGDELAMLEQMAHAAEAFLATDPIHEGPESLRARVVARVEHRARTGGRLSFPTVAGKRNFVIEATAIWMTSESLKRTQPGLALAKWKVKAERLSSDQPFSWDVTFIDPATLQTHKIRTSFSESTVYDYLAKNP